MLCVGIALDVSVAYEQLLITVTASDTLETSGTTGLFGVYNGNMEDDLMPPNDTVHINANSTEEEIFHNFGKLCKCYMLKH